MERMKDRLEDKLLQVSTGKTLYNVDNDSGCLCEACTNISAQMATVESSVNSMGTSLVSLTDKVHVVGQSMPNATALDHKLDTIITEVSGIATVTNNLTSGVQTQASTCAHQTPGPEDEFFDVLETGRREWRLAFRGTASNNVQIYPAYMNGTGIPTEVEAACKQFSMSLPCANHYRNRVAMEKWASLVNVDQVLLALYEKGQIVKLIRFNGKGSTPTSWFEGQRVLQSSWTDLKSKSHNYFSIEGDARFDLLRRFIVNHKYGGCPGDEGWLIVSDSVPGGCPYEKKQAAPAFIYAKGSTAAVWETHEVGRADAMGIFIKYL
ncbi:hypothetical protein EGW08_007914 [Elysia chlorotica]|uniref:Uncharacterized protein n=1 Tax=Elysia chlorotica TaxID=188477 RepID=A0A433TS04_ELYCH|nr:hypothetical protein EGW08_007914 [Elysia chlorotica]